MSGGRAIAAMLARSAAGLVLSLVLVLGFPSAVLTALAPVLGLAASASSPYLAEVVVTVEDRVVTADGQITLDMTLSEGSALPAIPGSWHKHGGQLLHLFVIAFTMAAAPRTGWRTRLPGLALTAALAAIAGACVFAVEVQVTALQAIGEGWLAGLPLARTEANVAAFQSMEQWYGAVSRLKSVNDGGGTLLLGVISGLAGISLAGGLRRSS